VLNVVYVFRHAIYDVLMFTHADRRNTIPTIRMARLEQAGSSANSSACRRIAIKARSFTTNNWRTIIRDRSIPVINDLQVYTVAINILRAIYTSEREIESNGNSKNYCIVDLLYLWKQ